MRGFHWTWLLGLAALGLGALGLAWIDVLPGGWTLRGWVIPHAQREERLRLQHREQRLAEFRRNHQFQRRRAVRGGFAHQYFSPWTRRSDRA
ncbi:MAG: hypothetical protein R3F17_16760 [Planctomycetota bacterium]